MPDRRPILPLPTWVTIALVALMVVGAGATGAVAQRLITGKDIADGSVTGRDIRDKSLRIKEVAPSARRALRGATGAVGPVGPQGPQGDLGPAQAIHAYGTGDVPLYTDWRTHPNVVLATRSFPAGSYVAMATVEVRSTPQDPGTLPGDEDDVPQVQCLVRTFQPWVNATPESPLIFLDDTSSRETLSIQASFTVAEDSHAALQCSGDEVTVVQRSLIIIRTGSLQVDRWPD